MFSKIFHKIMTLGLLSTISITCWSNTYQFKDFNVINNTGKTIWVKLVPAEGMVASDPMYNNNQRVNDEQSINFPILIKNNWKDTAKLFLKFYTVEQGGVSDTMLTWTKPANEIPTFTKKAGKVMTYDNVGCDNYICKVEVIRNPNQEDPK